MYIDDARHNGFTCKVTLLHRQEPAILYFTYSPLSCFVDNDGTFFNDFVSFHRDDADAGKVRSPAGTHPF